MDTFYHPYVDENLFLFTGGYDSWRKKGPTLCVLPFGSLHFVFVGQMIQENILQRIEELIQGESIIFTSSRIISNAQFFVYIDDKCSLGANDQKVRDVAFAGKEGCEENIGDAPANTYRYFGHKG